MKRLKVVRVYKSLNSSGGVHTRLMELLPRLREHVDVRMLCYRGRGDRAGELEGWGIPVDVIPMGVKWTPWNLRRYADYFARQKPHVVHAHEYTANTIGIVGAAQAGVPVRVRHVHSLAPWGWEGALRTRLRIGRDRRAARQAQLTLAVSEAVRSRYLAATGLEPDSCRVLYNGVDLRRFERCREERFRIRQEWHVHPESPLVGTVGRLSRGKGHREFLLAARSIGDAVPKVRFVLVGSGGLLGELKRLAADLGLSQKVVFAGEHNDIPAVLGAMDLFLFTAVPDEQGRIQDGLPGGVIEAMAAGVPVVGFRLPMMEELIEDGNTGALVSTGDVQGLARVSQRLLGDELARSEISTRASRFAERFSIDACVSETMSTYESLLAAAGGSA